MRRFLFALVFPVVLVVAGTVGYVVIEGWSLFDALYMTVTTLATVGFSEVHPLSTAGRAFTVVLILGGVFTLFYAAGVVIGAIADGQLGRHLRRRRMERSLSQLENHVIVCGFGRMGRRVCAEFSALKVPFVVIERSAESLEDFPFADGVAMHDDATDDEVLRKAGIARARALVTVVASDADNLYITMSARLLNEQLFILARAEDEHAEAKMARAGATRVVSPYAVTGYRVAQSVIRPAVVDFIEVATGTQHLDLQMEETRLAPASALVGKSLATSRLRQELGVIVVAIKKASGRMVYNPPAEDPMEAGDVLIAIGHPTQLERLESAARGP